MRPLIALVALPLFVVVADAEPKGGGKGGGGVLSGVSSGLGGASRGGGGSSGGGSSSGGSSRDNDRGDVDRRIADVCYDGTGRRSDPHGIDDCRDPMIHHDGNAVAVRRRARFEPPSPPAQFSIYAGAQKLHDSDGSASLELAVTDWRMRLNATVSRYYERQPDDGMLTMTMPALTGGFRIDDMGPTAVYLEGGVVLVRTKGDAMGDTKLTGGIAGVRVEHSLPSITLLGDVQQMWFDHEIKATSGRVGVRYKFLQAGFRVLDFNVGPALYGPEVGVRF